jgi:RNA polymerase sigma-70 factor (ECF subfamily)
MHIHSGHGETRELGRKSDLRASGSPGHPRPPARQSSRGLGDVRKGPGAPKSPGVRARSWGGGQVASAAAPGERGSGPPPPPADRDVAHQALVRGARRSRGSRRPGGAREGRRSGAFGILFDRYHGPVFRQLLAQTRSRALAEDLTSETFFKALRAVNGFALPSRLFGPWLRRIARNLAADHFKASRTRLEHVTSDLSYFEDLVASPEDIVVQRVDHQALREALRRLPVNQQRAVTLRFLGELSITETAEILGCSEGAAKQLQWRGLRNLSNLLRDEVRRT